MRSRELPRFFNVDNDLETFAHPRSARRIAFQKNEITAAVKVNSHPNADLTAFRHAESVVRGVGE